MKTQIFINNYGSGKIWFNPQTNRRLLTFFGNRFFDREVLFKAFPQKKIILLKQTHSNIVIDVDTESFDSTKPLIGDAAFSTQNDVVLAVQTADCLPVLYADEDLQRHGFIHAGWRGVENLILIQFLKKTMAERKQGYFEVGPHITQKNFEVDYDVAQQILKTIQVTLSKEVSEKTDWFFFKGSKVHLDLLQILQQQVKGWKRDESTEIQWDANFCKDVFDDQNFHSYRREKQNAGRNLSLTTVLNAADFETSPLFLPRFE